MALVLVLGLFVVIATAHNITYLEVPPYGDPRKEVELICHYMSEKNDPALQSVKWYRDKHEIFRFTPAAKPPERTRTFNASIGAVSRGSCNAHSCGIRLVLPKDYKLRIPYTCEVSTEGPRFEVVKKTKNLTIAVTLQSNPEIVGIPEMIHPGQELVLNCTTEPAMPPANLKWYVDGIPEKPFMDNTETSRADEDGLRSSWRALRLVVPTSRNKAVVTCEATQPVRPPYARSSNATVSVTRTPSSSFRVDGSSPSSHKRLELATLLVTSIVFLLKHSAFSHLQLSYFV